jgi:hypothetical protein
MHLRTLRSPCGGAIPSLGGLPDEGEQYTITRFRTWRTGWWLAYLALIQRGIRRRNN